MHDTFVYIYIYIILYSFSCFYMFVNKIIYIYLVTQVKLNVL